VDWKNRLFGAPLIPTDQPLEEQLRESLSQPVYVLSFTEQWIVCNAIRNISNEKGWHLIAVHVRTNHVHVVITANRDASRLMSDLKARASRDLNRAGFDSSDRKRWTRHGSTHHLFLEEDLGDVVAYVLNEQGERMAWYASEEVFITKSVAQYRKKPRIQ
jgi:REP element-mobilizing transposase RayT